MSSYAFKLNNKNITTLIEERRKELHKLVSERKEVDEVIIKKSQELDDLLNQFFMQKKGPKYK